MKISVTQSRKVKEWYDVFGGDKDRSAILHYVTYTKHKLAFLVEMSDGRSYTSTHVVSGSSDYHESLGMVESVINDIPQFSQDVERVTFPDLSFYDGYDEYAAAELGNDRGNVAIWLMYPEDREAAEREVIDNLVKQLVSAYSSEYFGDEYAGFEAYIWDMIGGTYCPPTKELLANGLVSTRLGIAFVIYFSYRTESLEREEGHYEGLG